MAKLLNPELVTSDRRLEYRIVLSCFYRVILEVRSIFMGGGSIGDGEKKVHINICMYLLSND